MRILFALLLLGAASPVGAASLSDAEARAAIRALGSGSGASAREAIASVVDAGDIRFVAVFIELMHAAQTGLASPVVVGHSATVLEALSGRSFGTDWQAWVRWYRGTDLVPPPGFADFKGELLAPIDPRFASLLSDEHPSRVRVEEIVWGGVPYEGIRALDQPKVVAATEASELEAGDAVFGIVVGGDARAYPLRILDWHEMANDRVGEVPVSLAYCTLCGSGIAYDTRTPGREPFDFGSSGLLMRSNKLMVDRQTKTLWNQFTGRPVLGPLAAEEGLKLAVLPSVVTTWAAWRARHPDTTVLSFDTGFERPYHAGAAYAGYFASDGTMFPTRLERPELAAKERVFGLEREGLARAYALDVLLAERVVNDRFAGQGVTVVASGQEIWIDGDSVRAGKARYAAGAEVRAYGRGPHEFRLSNDPSVLLDQRGRPWRLTEEALVGPGGERLARVPGVLAYWFGWHGFHPRTELYRPAAARR